VIDKAGHGPHNEQPDEVFASLSEFLPAADAAPAMAASPA
jgi:pimeloyl-ACP methyl ester carboxylesterase